MGAFLFLLPHCVRRRIYIFRKMYVYVCVYIFISLLHKKEILSGIYRRLNGVNLTFLWKNCSLIAVHYNSYYITYNGLGRGCWEKFFSSDLSSKIENKLSIHWLYCDKYCIVSLYRWAVSFSATPDPKINYFLCSNLPPIHWKIHPSLHLDVG